MVDMNSCLSKFEPLNVKPKKGGAKLGVHFNFKKSSTKLSTLSGAAGGARSRDRHDNLG